MVLGLDRGGSCTGLLMHVDAVHSEEVREALWEREMTGGAYEAKTIQVMPYMTANSVGAAAIGRASLSTPIDALAFVINRQHPRYAGKLCLDTQAGLIAMAHGKRGPNLTYLSETVASLKRLGCCPDYMNDLLQKANQCCGQSGEPRTVLSF